MSELEEQIKKKAYLCWDKFDERAVLLSDVLGLLDGYVCIPKKQLEDEQIDYGQELARLDKEIKVAIDNPESLGLEKSLFELFCKRIFIMAYLKRGNEFWGKE